MANRTTRKGYYGYFGVKKEAEEITYRIAMRVTEVKVYSFGDSCAVCPRCKRGLIREFVKFCDSCGQKLEWRGYGKAKIIRVPPK